MKRKAFTLAETLITLGIIGVVAAMTLPVLIQKYNKIVWVNQLKKSVSVVENGFKLAMAEDEVDNIFDTNIISSSLNNYTYIDERTNYISENLKKYFNISKIKPAGSFDEYAGYKSLTGQINEDGDGDYASSAIYLTDGSLIYISVYENVIEFIIDVNGDKLPNTYGRDSFFFEMYANGKLIPLNNEITNCSFTNTDAMAGGGCAARIIENGWKMDY